MPRPGLALIVAAENPAIGVLNERINDIGVAAVEIDADAPDLFDCLRIRLLVLVFVGNNRFLCVGIPWQTLFQFLPGRAAVGGLIDA